MAEFNIDTYLMEIPSLIGMLLDNLYNTYLDIIDMLPNTLNEITGAETFSEIISYSAYFFPLDMLIVIVNNFLFWYGIHLTYAIIEWVYKKIPGVN